jgi:hypothetical protein
MADDQNKAIDDIRDSIRSLSDELRVIRERFDQQQQSQSDRKRQFRNDTLVVVCVTIPLTAIAMLAAILAILLHK